MPAFSTRCSAVTVGTFFHKATMWSIEIVADEIDVTNFETGGFVDYIGSYVQANWNFDAFVSDDDNVTFAGDENAASLNPGKEITDLRMWYTGRDVFRAVGVGNGDDDCFHFPLAVCLQMTPTSAVRDAHRISVRGRNKGEFFYPQGVSFSGILCN